MSNNPWNYYQSLKPMVILLAAFGLFSLHKNPHASKFLKFLTVATVTFRFSCTLIAWIMFLFTLYVNGTRELVSNIQSIMYGFYCLINVSFLLGFHFHSMGVELVRDFGCNNELKKNWATRAFLIRLSIYIVCVASSLAYQTIPFFDEIVRGNYISAFYPFKVTNSLELFFLLYIIDVILTSGDYICAVYYSHMCIILYLKYKHFNKELKQKMETDLMVTDLDIEEKRQKYNNLQNITNDFNSSHSCLLVFNVTHWLLYILTLSYIVIKVHVDRFIIMFITNALIMLFVQLFAASLLYSEVSGFLGYNAFFWRTMINYPQNKFFN